MSENHFFACLREALGDPGRPFIKGPPGRTVTYAEVFERTARYANLLAALGVRPGDRVAVQARKSAEALLFYLAVVRAGAVYLPLNTAYTTAEVDYFLRDAEPRLAVCDAEALGAMGALAEAAGVADVLTLDRGGPASAADRADRAPADFADRPRAPGDLAAILYTSGTTGRSKGAMLTHANLTTNALALREAWRFTGDDVLIHALPIFHTHGLFVATNVTLMAGGAMIVLPKFDVDAIIAALPRATCLMGVPTFYTRLLASGRLSPALCAHMRLFVSGSAPLLAETHAEFEKATGHAILERYGMTETNMITSNPHDGARRAGTVGFPLPGVEIRVTDPETGAPRPDGEIGMIEVRGPNVFSGYWRMPEKTAAEFRADGFFVTGDLGRIDEHGYLAIIGREKDLIISGGLNVYPKEVESEIDALPGVLESAVIGVPHPDLGEAVVAAVVPRPGAAVGPDRVVAGLGARLARYKLPKKVVIVEELPRNTMGKVQKSLMRARFAAAFAGPDDGRRKPQD